MNYLQLVQRLHRESGRSGSGPTAIIGASKDHQRLFDWVADACRNLESRPIDWRWLRESLTAAPTVSGQGDYTGTDLGATDFGRWRVFSDDYTVKCYLPATPTNVWRLAWMEPEQFKERYDDLQPADGKPMHWTISDGDALRIGPAPDDIYSLKVDYLREPQELAADADVPGLPARFHLMLMWRALVDVGKFDNAADVLARASTNFAALESALIDDQARAITLGAPLV